MNVQQIIDDRLPVIASFSGGKDSTALVLYLLYESGIAREQLHIVFADTGWEHPYTYLQILRMAERHPVQVVRSDRYPGGMPQLMKERGIPIQRARFCTQELKVFPIRKYLSKFDTFVQAKGIRIEEATPTNGRDVEEFELDLGTMMYSWYPIRNYTLQDVWGIHHRYTFPINKLYALGFSRVGCAPCIFARKNELAVWGDIAKGHIDIIREAENQRDFPYISPTGKPLQYHNRTRYNGKTYANIDNVLHWANTPTKDHKYFNPDEEIAGTCSEGLCE